MSPAARTPLSSSARDLPLHGLRWLLVLALVGWSTLAWADEVQMASNTQAGGDSLSARVTMGSASKAEAASDAPRLTAERSRMSISDAPAVGPDGRVLTDLAGLSYRWWANHGQSDVGVGVGTLGHLVTTRPGSVDGTGRFTGNVPVVTVGWRYRTSPGSVVFADASGARGLGSDANVNYVNTKVGAEFKAATSRFGVDARGHLGMQLDSGYRMSLRLKRSAVGIYLRGQF